MVDPEKNKRTALAYYNLAFNDRRPAEAVEKYGGSHYIQHNPQAPDGFEAFTFSSSRALWSSSLSRASTSRAPSQRATWL
jgi:predicted SnoaL-like aldol condensation-catalyzing enzyme